MPDPAAPAETPGSPPAVGLQPEPAPTSPSPETPASGPGPAAEPTPTGGEPGAEAEQQAANWWTSQESEEALWEHEQAKSRLEESDKAGFKRGRTETQQRMQPFLQTQTKHLKSIDDSALAFIRGFDRIAKGKDAAGDPVFEPQALSDFMHEHKEMFDALRGVHQEAGKWAGSRGLVAEISKALEDSDFFTEFDERIDSVSQGMTDPTLVSDLVESITASAKEQWEKTERPKLEKQVRERLETEFRAQNRLATPPPAGPAGGGGGGEVAYVEVVGTLTPDQIDELTRRFAK